MKPASLTIKDLRDHTMILKVHVTPQFGFRLALAKSLFVAGAWVLGCKVEIT